jgi:hypothetical protein
MKKPTGRNGFMRIQAGQDGTAEGTYHQLQLPDAKADVERRIAEWFVSAMAKASQAGSMEPMFWDVQANVENDFDFTVSTPPRSGKSGTAGNSALDGAVRFGAQKL